MAPIRIKYVVSYSSQDARHSVDNLVKGCGSWLSNTSDRSGRLQADLQLERAVMISYLDLGNSGSVTISVEVGRSSWPTSRPLVTLLPTVALMTPSEWRSGKNINAVRMFKQCDFNTEAAKEKWDKVRIVCTQPFRKDAQFGLSLFRLHANSEIVSIEDPMVSFDTFRVQDPLVSTFKDDAQKHKVADMKKEELVSRMNLPAVKKKIMSQSIGWLENKVLTNGEEAESGPSCNPLTSPVSRAARLLVMAEKPQNKQDLQNEKANLECEALDFLIGLNLTADDINTLKVSGVRRDFEKMRKKELSQEEKRIFKDIALDFAKERLKRLEMQNERVQVKGSVKNCDFNKSRTMGTSFNMKTNGVKTVDSKMKKAPEMIKDRVQTPHSNNTQERKIQGLKKRFTFKHMDTSGNLEKSNNVSAHSVSRGRQKLREEDDLKFKTSSASPRNSVALGDSRVVTPKRSWNGKSKTSSQETNGNLQMSIDDWFTKSKRMKEDISSLESQEVFITEDHSCDKVDSGGGGFLIDPVLYSGNTLGSAPTNKFGLRPPEASTHNSGHNASMVECPLCSGFFESTKIEAHAASCGVVSSDSDLTDMESEDSAVNHKQDKDAMEECPVCGDFIVRASLEDHTSACAASSFPD